MRQSYIAPPVKSKIGFVPTSDGYLYMRTCEKILIYIHLLHRCTNIDIMYRYH